MKVLKKNKIYTGVGSRSTPLDQQNILTSLSKKLSSYGYTLRSGHAEGADMAFEKGTRRRRVYAPWEGFNGFSGDIAEFTDDVYNFTAGEFEEHQKDGVYWKNIRDSTKKLMIRNVFQVIGHDFKNPVPSDFLMCWADVNEGEVQGGTGFTVHLAKKFDIPVFNINDPEDLKNSKILLTCIKYDYRITLIRQLMWFHYSDLDSESQNILDEFQNIEYIKETDEYKNYFDLYPLLTKDFTVLVNYLFKKHRDILLKDNGN